jgi:hypothetical protein
MTMHIANWKLSVQLRHQATTPPTDPTEQRVQRVRMGEQIARTREQAQAQWILMGGPQSL